MTKNLNKSEKETLISLYLSEAIQNFRYPNEEFFKNNREILKVNPKSAQLNGLWQMALNAQNIDKMCNELVRKVSKATLPEWRIEVVNTLEWPVPRERVELWKFLVQSLIYIRDDSRGFMSRWLNQNIKTINIVLQENNYGMLTSFTLSTQQRLELALSFIHRFATKIIIERKMMEE